MAVKTLTITEDAYNTLKSKKHENESFSEVIKRVVGAPLKIKDLLGALKTTPEEGEAFKKRVKEIHERLGKDFERRIKDVRSRYLSND